MRLQSIGIRARRAAMVALSCASFAVNACEEVCPVGTTVSFRQACGKSADGCEAAGTDRRPRSPAPKVKEPAPSAAQFVAVQMKTATCVPSLTIELIRESGERMRIESAGALDLAGIVQAFWRRS